MHGQTYLLKETYLLSLPSLSLGTQHSLPSLSLGTQHHGVLCMHA